MLQQTQAPRVVAKYKSFLKRFPTFQALAKASLQDVLTEWQGLGYNRRAKYLREIAQTVTGSSACITFPTTPETLTELPGIGPNTAGSILAFAFNKPVAFIETNIRSVFIHFFFSKVRRKISDKEILKLVEQSLDPKIHPRAYTEPREWFYALMDYGNMLKEQQRIDPARKSALYKKQSSFKVSNREVRSAIIKLILKHASESTHNQKNRMGIRLDEIVSTLIAKKGGVNSEFRTKENIIRNVQALEKEGFIERATEHNTDERQVYRIRK